MNNIKNKFLKVFALAEAIAFLIAFIPIMIQYFNFVNNHPTDAKFLVDFMLALTWFVIGQIPGWLISAIVYGLFGRPKL